MNGKEATSQVAGGIAWSGTQKRERTEQLGLAICAALFYLLNESRGMNQVIRDYHA